MAARRVVPSFDEFEDGHAGLGLGLEAGRSSNSDSRVAKKLSHMALSKQSPTEPIGGRTPASSQRLPKASEVYWCRGRVMNHGARTALAEGQVERRED